MKHPKRLMKVIVGFAALVGLLLLAFLVVPGLTSILEQSGSTAQVRLDEAAYLPPKQTGLAAQMAAMNTPYPGPEMVIASRPVDDCSKAGTWVEYTNHEAGFLFQYPAESDILESVDQNGNTDIRISLHPWCYTETWAGARHVSIGTLENPRNLALEDFVVERYRHDFLEGQDPDFAQEMAESLIALPLDQVNALQVNGRLSKESPHTYFLLDDSIIYISLYEMNMMPPFGTDAVSLDLYNKILRLIQLQTNPSTG